MAAKEIPPDACAGTISMIKNWAFLGKSWARTELNVLLGAKMKEEPVAQIKLGWSHPPLSAAEPVGEQSGSREKDESYPPHQTATVKRKTRLKMPDFFD